MLDTLVEVRHDDEKSGAPWEVVNGHGTVVKSFPGSGWDCRRDEMFARLAHDYAEAYNEGVLHTTMNCDKLLRRILNALHTPDGDPEALIKRRLNG